MEAAGAHEQRHRHDTRTHRPGIVARAVAAVAKKMRRLK
jgi:hypothetical protein